VNTARKKLGQTLTRRKQKARPWRKAPDEGQKGWTWGERGYWRTPPLGPERTIKGGGGAPEADFLAKSGRGT